MKWKWITALSVAFLLVTMFSDRPEVRAQGAAKVHQNVISWNWAQGSGDPASGFIVLKASAQAGPFTTISTISSASTLSYTDTAVAVGQTNYYEVEAFNSGGDSVPSNIVACVTPFFAPSSAPVVSATSQ